MWEGRHLGHLGVAQHIAVASSVGLGFAFFEVSSSKNSEMMVSD